jgi:DNA-binding transcriptional MerR regulator
LASSPRHSNLNPSAIRRYEKNGLLPAPARRNGRHVYSSEAAEGFYLSGFAKETSFSLPELKLLPPGFHDGRRSLAQARHRQIAQLESSIAKARAMEGMLRSIMKCRCVTIDQCVRGLSNCMKTHPAREAKRRSS